MSRKQSVVTIHMFAMTLIAVLLLFGSVRAQESTETSSDPAQVARETSSAGAEPTSAKPSAATPTSSGFMGIKIGMSADEVREKLGKLKDKGKSQDFFVFSDLQSGQVYYDAQGKVMALSFDFIGTKSDPPTPEKVLGESLQAKPDGSMYQLKRYPDVGFWISYSRTAGADPITTVTIQKM